MKAHSAHGRAPSARCLLGHPSGFSLVEMILVVAAISVLSLIAVPRFANARARYRIEGAAYRLKADIERAQAFARAASKPVRIEFRDTTSTYFIGGLKPIDGPAADTTVALAAEPYGTTIADMVIVDSSAFYIDGYGRLITGGKVLLSSSRETRVVEWSSAEAGVIVRRPLAMEFSAK